MENQPMIKTIPARIKTPRLIIADAHMDECNELQDICSGWDEKVSLEGEPFEPEYIYKCLTEGDLPPLTTASKGLYQLKSVYLKDSGHLIGFIDLYHGYPSIDTLWISIFLLKKEFQQNGYAREVIGFLADESRRLGYLKIGIGVYLKNWKGLRFWTRAGFDRITGIAGDKDYGVDNFARIYLEKLL